MSCCPAKRSPVRGGRAIATLVAFAALVASAAGQVVGEVPSGGNLNVFPREDYRTSEPVLISRDDVAVVIQTLGPAVPSLAAFLSVLRGVDGRPTQEFIAIPNLGVGEVWHRIFQLTADRAVMPGSGLDGVFATPDDEVLVIDGLAEPGQMTVQRRALGRNGPRPDYHVMVLGDDLIAWLDHGPDSEPGTPDDGVVAIEIDATTQTVDVSLPVGGIDSRHFVEMEPRRYGLRGLGEDAVLGTPDDVVAMLFRAPDGSTAISAVKPSRAILDLPREPGWPRYIGNGTLVYFTPSAEDVDLIFVGGFDSAIELASTPAPMGTFLVGETGPGLAPVTEDGVMLVPGLGPDFVAGTADDSLVRITHPALGPGAESLPLPQTLAGKGGHPELMQDLHYLGDGVCVSAHTGTDFEDGADDGLVVIRGVTDEAPRIDLFPTFEAVSRVVPMGSGTAAVILSSGLVVYLVVNDGTILALPTIGQSFAFESEPTAISASIFCAITHAMDLSDPLDVMQFWRMPAAYTYGDASPNDLGFSMNIGTDAVLPSQGATFKVTLTSAPPSRFGYLVCSTHRGQIPITGDVDLLVDPAGLVRVWPWFTLSTGTTALTMSLPQQQDLRGLTLSFQWIIHSPGSPRSFEASAGLSMAF